MGLGTLWIGERYDTKDLGALAGALSQATRRVQVAAGITHPYLRHPMVLASMGQTLQALTGGRFRLGLGRSASWRGGAPRPPAPPPPAAPDARRPRGHRRHPAPAVGRADGGVRRAARAVPATAAPGSS